MSYNGTGIYTLPGAQLINGEVVSATENNQFRNDVATALNTAWTRDGQAPATNNIPMANHKFTGLLPGTENGDSVCYEQVTSNVHITGGTIDNTPIGGTTPNTGNFTDLTTESLEVTGNATIGDTSSDALTINGTAVSIPNGLNFDSNTLFIDSANNNVGIGTNAPTMPLSVNGVIQSITGGFKFPDGTVQTSSAYSANFISFTASGTYTIPSGVTSIRAYAFGAGANADATNGGGGGGCAFGNIPVTPGDSVVVSISSGVAKVTINGTEYLQGGKASGIYGGSASKHASVTSGGAYIGGNGGASLGGGGSAGSPLGNGFNGGSNKGGGAGAGGVGGSGSGNVVGGGGGAGGAGGGSSVYGSGAGGGGGAGGPAQNDASFTYVRGGAPRSMSNKFADPLMAHCTSPGASYCQTVYGNYFDVAGINGGAGGGGAGISIVRNFAMGGNGGDFAGGGAGIATGDGTGAAIGIGGNGGFGGGGGAGGGASGWGGNGGYGGGGGAPYSSYGGGRGGDAIVLIYA